VAATIAADWIWTSLALGADAISDDAMRTLIYLDAAAFYIAVFPFAVFVTAGSLVIVSTGGDAEVDRVRRPGRRDRPVRRTPDRPRRRLRVAARALLLPLTGRRGGLDRRDRPFDGATA
jgi:hypothetical protein